jgi:transposase-like protein
MKKSRKKGGNPTEKDETGIVRDLPAICNDEQLAVEFLEKYRWGDSPACPRCGDTSVYQMQDRITGRRNRRFLWRCNGCGDQYTVRIGTIFEDTRIPLRHWCFAIWAACSAKKGVSALQIRRQTQISYKSALFMMHRIRFLMTDGLLPPKLTGTVEADETWVGGKLRPRERREWGRLKGLGVDMRRVPRYQNKTPVMAMVERGGDVRAVVLPNVNADNVRSVLQTYVSPEAHLRTDEAAHYLSVGQGFASHEAVKHSLYEYVRGDASTNMVESFFSRLKRQLYGTHHAVSKRHLHRYVAEVVFKHNTRKLDDGQRVIEAIQRAEGKRLVYQDSSAA